jgi:hypothetical protein
MLKSYDFQDQIRDLEAGISLIINDAPILLGLIGLNGVPHTQTKFEWMQDHLNSNRANASAGFAAGDTTITLVAGDGGKFRVNAVLVFGDEYMKVTAVNGDQITVVRGFDGTTAGTGNAGDELRIVARPQLEGAMPGVDEGHDRLVQFNYTQIFERYASVTNTRMHTNVYNVGDELNYQVQLRLKELAREMNDSIIYGRRIDAGAGAPRMTGGLLNFANLEGSFKLNNSGAELSAKSINDSFEEIFKRGGMANTILTNTAGARQISKMADAAIRTQRTDSATGHQISTIVSDMIGGGEAVLVVDPNMPKDKIVLFDRNILEFAPLQGRQLYDVDASIPGKSVAA